MSEGQVDNWVFDSLVNFLHGSIWKVPVVGFIEEKSVVFDPDSYNNMTEEKEEEFKKIHDEYKAVVDFMLSSFMEDLQVTPEQVEEACRVREHQSKSLPESHITKVALEQLWAAEDFTAFRRLMTRKNIDLQLQSLELLVAKYGVLSPSLRSGDSDEPTGEDGEDDFLQVVIRYSDQLELFKCDYGADETSCPGRDNCKSAGVSKKKSPCPTIAEDSDNKNMKLHLSGIQFKNNVAPTPVKYQATLVPSATPSANNEIISHDVPSSEEPEPNIESSANNAELDIDEMVDNNPEISEVETSPSPCLQAERESSASPTPNEPETEPTPTSPEHTPSANISSCTSPLLAPLPPEDTENAQDETLPDQPELGESSENIVADAIESNSDNPDIIKEENIPSSHHEVEAEEQESQLIQLEEAEAAIAEESKLGEADLLTVEEEATAGETPEETTAIEPKETSPKQAISPRLDEKTAAEIAITAPEQRRLLTAVRKALEVNPDESEVVSSIDIPSSGENDDDLQKRREYLRAQRDKLIAMKKQEREKLLLANTSESGPQSSRPKSARAAQLAIKNPLNMRAASIGSEKSLSARRALADRLKQELIEKQ